MDVSWCERVTADVGKCLVCELVRAEWVDRESGVKLCEHCYAREVRGLFFEISYFLMFLDFYVSSLLA